MKNIFISLKKDKDSWQIWDAWAQLQIINNITIKIVNECDTLACDLSKVYTNDLDYLNKYFSNYKTVILFDLLDIKDYNDNKNTKPRFPDKLKYLTNEKIIVVTQDYYFSDQTPKNIKVLYHDYLLNRSKFYLMYGLDLCKEQQPGYPVWYHENDNNYYKPDVPMELVFTPATAGHTPNNRKYAYIFAGNRTTTARTAIYQQLNSIKTLPGIVLYGDKRLDAEKDKPIPNYKPLPANIYREAYINIYSETNVEQNNLFNTAHLTEKTIEPVLRFQMILPFSTTNYYKYLDKINLQICQELVIHDWRTIEDDENRLEMFLLNLQSIAESYTLTDIRDIYYNNLDIIRNNSFNLYSQPFCHSIRKLYNFI